MLKHLSTKLLMLAAILFCGVTSAFAQGGTVTGVVTDASDGMFLPGATIVVKGTTQGTVTDINGSYSIQVNANQVLEFSYVGYATQEFVVQPGTTLNVVLQSSAQSLEGVVIIGYGSVKKKDATGSVSVVGQDEFNKGAITNPVGLIAGKVAGVQITSNSGAPGEASTIRIRGGSSLNANNNPLIVIDGVVTSGEGGSGSRSALNALNPADIESFTVLKDASATAIYGSRASNGVILITTKKGREGSPLKLEYDGKLSFYEKPKPLGVLSSDEFVKLFTSKNPNQVNMLGVYYDQDGHQVAGNDSDSTNTHTIYNTDWQDEIYRSAFAMDHSLSATGAYKTMPYRVSLGYTDQDGTLKTSEFTRTTISAALNPTFFKGYLKLNINANGTFIKNRFANRSAIGAAAQMDPTKPVLSTDGSYGGYYAWLGNGGGLNSMATSNPVALLEQQTDKSDLSRFYGNFQADYKFHFFPDLRANINLAIDNSDNKGTVYVPNYAAWATDNIRGGGRDDKYTGKNKNELLDFYLNYKKEVPSIASVFDVMAGYSWQHFWYENTWDNKNIPIIIDPVTGDSTGQKLYPISGVDRGELFLVSFFGRLNYSFMDKYLLTATVRQDGTSRFSEDNRWGLFPAVGLAWKINEEGFLRDSKVISQLKLRIGWGKTGQQDVGGYYGYQGGYSIGTQNSMYPFGNVYDTVIRPNGYNPNIKWETTTTMNIGIDYGFFNDRLYGSIEYYNRKTTDLLTYAPVPAGTNFVNNLNQNIGDLENRGVEFSINGRIISNEEMFWELGLNATYNKNEITMLYDGASLENSNSTISGGVGNVIQIHQVGESASSFFVYEQVYDNDGNPIQGLYVDRNGDGIINSSDKYIYKNPNAPLYFGISSTFNYKKWAFFFSGRANFGNYVYNNAQSELATFDRLYRDEGPYAGNVLSSATDINFNIPQYFSDYFVQEASFFRMDDITLSYTFENLLKNSLNIRVSATCNNAFVITNYDGLDPEVFGGIDNNLYPRSRVWVFGVNLQF
ncbi:MAG: TonB-dependent receptor [Bacteroidetes bacterium]|nr:TonB-dependent receptor [Bacteroidota bacterium]